MLWGDEELNGAGSPGLTLDKAFGLQGEHHAVHAWRGDAEVSLHIGFGRWLAVELGIGVDEGEVLALCVGE